MAQAVAAETKQSFGYGYFLTFIAGLGGLLYGVDIGIISAALLYVDKSIHLSLEQTSLIVAAVLAGGTISSLVAGFLADWLGRRTMMIVSGALFSASGVLIATAHSFLGLFLGRLLQGLSCGVIAVVVPLYLAESLSAKKRGSGSGIFQLMLTAGIVMASVVGLYYTRQTEAAIAAAQGNASLIFHAQDHAWRSMMASVIYPGVLFCVGSIFLKETPRWLFRHGRREAALQALLLTSTRDEAETQIEEMGAITQQEIDDHASGAAGSLFQKRYIVPFLLACLVLACNQATGINSVLSYLVVILKQAGLSVERSTQFDFLVKLLNCLMTIVAVALVDRKGRRFLLRIGTAGVTIALLVAAFTFHAEESKRTDVREQLQASATNNVVDTRIASFNTTGAPMEMLVSYSYGAGDQIMTAITTEKDGAIHLAPEPNTKAGPLVIKHAWLGPIPSQHTGNVIALCMALFIAAFAVGPGVVVWLMLSELMPTRIRSSGMGIALLINQGVSTTIAGVFLPVAGRYGYAAMFGFWAACTIVYFLTATFLLPETKGKTLEEIEMSFR